MGGNAKGLYSMSSMTVNKTGELQVGKFTLSKIGVAIDGTPSFEEWQEAMTFTQRSESGVMWWIGDLLNEGEKRYGETYTQAIGSSDYSYETVKQAKYVAGAVELCTRIHNLSWKHHQIVAPLDSKAQAKWLKKASANSWSSAELRKAIKESNKPDETPIIAQAPVQEEPGDAKPQESEAKPDPSPEPKLPPRSDADESKPSLLDDMGIPVQDHAAEAFLAQPMFDEILKLLRQARTLYGKLAEHPGGAYLLRPGVSINAKDSWKHKGIQDAIASLEDCKPSLTVCPRAYHLQAFPDCKDKTPHGKSCTLCKGLNWVRKMGKGEVAPEVEAKIKEVFHL